MATRVENSIRNVFAAWGGQVVYAVGTFVVRAVFVSVLAQEYVGLESLFSSLLTILSLADLGVGSAIVFSLYKPLAEHDKELVKSLMRLFKRAYVAIGIAIICIGLILAPNIEIFLGQDPPDIPHLQLYFFCFVLNTGISYFFSYKGSLIMADQKNYIVYVIQYAFQILMCCAQVAVLLATHNYLLFLFCMICSTLLQNVCIAYKANKMYPYLKEKNVKPIDRSVLSQIKKNIIGLMMHKVAGVASTPVSNLVITNFVSLAATSLYGNYLLVINAVTRVLDKVFDSIVASVGNLGVKESQDRQYQVFQTTFFIDAFLYTVMSSGLFCAFNPFIALCFGESWEFPEYIVALIVLLFFVKGMRSAAMAFTNAYGLFWYTRWKAVLEAVFLPLLSLLLVFPFGVAGVLLAGVLSSVMISTPYEGWAVYRHGFRKPLRRYFLKFALYLCLAVAIAGLSFYLCSFIPWVGVVGLLVKGCVGVAVAIASFLIIFHRTREFGELSAIAFRVIKKMGIGRKSQ